MPLNFLATLPGLSGSVALYDHFGFSYPFDVYRLGIDVAADHSVYGFARKAGNSLVVLYIGRTGDLPQRLSGHHKLDDAIRLGADLLLVHERNRLAFPSLAEVERNLINRYNPILNEKHRTNVNALAQMWGGERSPSRRY
jgi:hypothetical protein